MKQISSIILAAGFSTRMYTDKALLKINNTPAIDLIIRKLLPFSKQIFITTGSNHQQICDLLHNLKPVQIIHNPSPQNGMFSSLKLAIQPVVTAYALIHLIDHPFIEPQTYRNLIDSLDDHHRVFKPVICQSARSGHPILISQAVMQLIRQAPQRDNLRNILHSLPEAYIKQIPVTDLHILDNINTPEQFKKFASH
jgi:CTP:molybdopterin cytidylyltransferase MocA